MPVAGNLRAWIEALPERGRYVFARAEAAMAAEANSAAITMILYRLKRSGAIVSPRRDFFVVVPREWTFGGDPYCDGHDPEGNVFPLREVVG